MIRRALLAWRLRRESRHGHAHVRPILWADAWLLADLMIKSGLGR